MRSQSYPGVVLIGFSGIGSRVVPMPSIIFKPFAFSSGVCSRYIYPTHLPPPPLPLSPLSLLHSRCHLIIIIVCLLLRELPQSPVTFRMPRGTMDPMVLFSNHQEMEVNITRYKLPGIRFPTTLEEDMSYRLNNLISLRIKGNVSIRHAGIKDTKTGQKAL